ncbi:hypothetical protein [Desulfatirhabdium butyrativorans]|uniref:hypothetical protein n=1 Tax=Desulfatirhabdium butyrativorans TaxID=340467 RepID=UPI000A01D9BA|nr:hypothetical protein [Desulfatirhabdium butyrativorans]
MLSFSIDSEQKSERNGHHRTKSFLIDIAGIVQKDFSQSVHFWISWTNDLKSDIPERALDILYGKPLPYVKQAKIRARLPLCHSAYTDTRFCCIIERHEKNSSNVIDLKMSDCLNGILWFKAGLRRQSGNGALREKYGVSVQANGTLRHAPKRSHAGKRVATGSQLLLWTHARHSKHRPAIRPACEIDRKGLYG